MKTKVLSASVLALLISLFSSCSKPKQHADYQIVPLPQQIEQQNGKPFTLSGVTRILIPEGNEKMQKNAEFLQTYIKEMTGRELTIGYGEKGDNVIILSLTGKSGKPEGYNLKINANQITISSASEAGVFYGIQTLRKSLPVSKSKTDVELAAVEINDAPRFAYRGTLFDVCRHFFTVDEVKTFIDMMALHNMNHLHLHISEDQGWRIEIKKYPRLTEIGSKRKETLTGHLNDRPEKYDGIEYGGYYTQKEAREIVKYAADRYITVVPEIDLPGHMQAALAAYPELGCTGGPYEVWTKWGISDNVLCAGNDKVLEFLDNVFDEIMQIFPSEYIHIGGDECPKTRWEQCPKCQARIKAEGIKNDGKHTKEQQLQSYVMQHVASYLNKHGRKVIGWDEILEGNAAEGATVMSWRGEAGGIEAAKLGHDVVMTPNSALYFDFYQSLDTKDEPLAIGGYIPVEKVYNYNPVPDALNDEEKKHIIGAQCNLWTEYIPTFSQVQYMVLPRWAALAEIQWSNPEKKNYKDFLNRLSHLTDIYRLEHYNFAKHVEDLTMTSTPLIGQGKLIIKLSTIGNPEIHYTLDGTNPTASSPIYKDSIEIDKPVTLKAIAIRNGEPGKMLEENISFSKATARKVTFDCNPHANYQAQGPQTLVDGLTGNATFGSGRWVGFYDVDKFSATVDLGSIQQVSKAAVNICIATVDAVFDARKISVYTSDDGTRFTEVATQEYPAMESDKKETVTHELDFAHTQARFVKIELTPENDILPWSTYKGMKAFVFIDEITID